MLSSEPVLLGRPRSGPPLLPLENKKAKGGRCGGLCCVSSDVRTSLPCLVVGAAQGINPKVCVEVRKTPPPKISQDFACVSPEKEAVAFKADTADSRVDPASHLNHLLGSRSPA